MATLYHGTTAKFKRFIKSKVNMDAYNIRGAYFSRDKSVAEGFSNSNQRIVTRDDSNFKLLKVNKVIDSSADMYILLDKLVKKGLSIIKPKVKKLALSNNKNQIDHRIINELLKGVSIDKLKHEDWASDRLKKLNGRFDMFDLNILGNVVNLLGYDGIDFNVQKLSGKLMPVTAITNLKKLNKRIGTQYKGR